jgi:hypothetical protein
MGGLVIAGWLNERTERARPVRSLYASPISSHYLNSIAVLAGPLTPKLPVQCCYQ